MCGIFGAVITPESKKKPLKEWSDTLFKFSESRGKEASGITTFDDKEYLIFRQPLRGSRLIKLPAYNEMFTGSTVAFVGHSRLVTNGSQTNNKNNQPVYTNYGTCVHNGVVTNDKEIFKYLKKTARSEVDTEAIIELIEYFMVTKKLPLQASIQKTFSKIIGSASIAYLSTIYKKLVLATNTGSLYFTKINKEAFVFASEMHILNAFLTKYKYNSRIVNILAGESIILDLNTFELESLDLKGNDKTKTGVKPNFKKEKISIREVEAPEIKEAVLNLLYSKRNSIKKIKSHDFDYQKINSLRRCVKCILPQTMPFISFDSEGVCNYCQKYKKVSYLGQEKLEKELEKYRSNSKRHDCIVAFSGGRDSSYTLHYLKKKMGMNPIAYTFDWGMITDLARRNQAKLVGKLGVEHILVSPDINYKRLNIRKNIQAWLRKPELGMVPLFMAGDKQAEYYVDQVAKQNNIKLVVYGSGCEMENDEFKAAYAGIKNAYPGAILHNMAIPGRIKMASYYALQFIKNPSYINSSLVDTLFGYFSIYVKRHDYLYLWYYLPWNEEQIVSTLKNDYQWEKDPNTVLTWRTDDGTPAFYNYIYYQVQGFTENDAFRSNQIREGVLSRKQALELVNKENLPRHEALKWYFDQLGLDGDKVLSAVDRIPKKY